MRTLTCSLALLAVWVFLPGSQCCAWQNSGTTIPDSGSGISQGTPASSRTYSIQYLSSKGKLEFAPRKAAATAETYDQISQNLESQISGLLTNRGLLGAPAAIAPGSHKVTIGLRVAWVTSGMDPLKPAEGAKVHVQAEISVADWNGNVVFEKVLEGKGNAGPSRSGQDSSKASETLAWEAGGDLVRKLDRDPAFTQAFSTAAGRVPGAASSAGASLATVPGPAAGSAAAAPPGFVVLPAGKPVMLSFDQDVDTTKARAGDPVNLTLAADVKMGDATVAKAGTRVAGSIFELPPSKGFMKLGGDGGEISGNLRVRIDYMALGDRLVRFRGGVDGKPEGWVPGAELLEKVETHRDMSVHEARSGVHVHIKAGTMLRAYTAENVSLPALH